MIRLWNCEFGEFPLPEDFPFHVFRKDGWWDKRFKQDRERGMAIVAAKTAELRDAYFG